MTQVPSEVNSGAPTTPNGRAVITRRVHAPINDVWSVLADGWPYATWVVGASRIREVEPERPPPGSRLHRSFGVWPALGALSALPRTPPAAPAGSFHVQRVNC